MGVAGLVLGTIAVVFALLPLIYTQYVGLVLGLVALVLGLGGRKQARQQEPPGGRGAANAGVVLGVVAAALSVAIYISYIYLMGQVGEKIEKESAQLRVRFQREMRREFGGHPTGSGEFRAALRKALERVQQQSDEDDQIREALDEDVHQAIKAGQKGTAKPPEGGEGGR